MTTADDQRRAELDALYSGARDAMAQSFDNLPASPIHIGGQGTCPGVDVAGLGAVVNDHRPVAVVRPVDDHGSVYSALAFVCPGCALMPGGGSGLHMLPVNSPNKSPQWDWDGNLAAPSLSPSILTRGADSHRCHSFLRDGVFEFLSDSTHPLAGQSVPLPPLPDWMVNRG